MLWHLLAAAEADLRARFTAAGAQAQIPTFHFGAEFLMQQEKPPRVVWVQAAGKVGPPFQVGRPVVNGTPQGRSIRTRRCDVEVHVWGDPKTILDDVEPGVRAVLATEELMHQVLISLHRTGVGVWDDAMTPETWTQAQPGGTKDVVHGREVVFVVPNVLIPVAEVTPQVVPKPVALDLKNGFPDSPESACETIPGGP